MKIRLSLSVRIAEGFLSKETAIMDLNTLADLARGAGYDAICMRASQVGVHSGEAEIRRASELLAGHSIPVSMVTGDYDIVYNNANGPHCLRRIDPYLDLAEALGAPIIRVALKERDDVEWARRAADAAAERGIRLAHQCHTLSLFETVDSIEETLRAIGRPNFGLIYEPANLELCGQDYGIETIRRLASWIFNMYLQNQILRSNGAISLDTWCRGAVGLDLIQVHEPGGIDFQKVIEGLAAIDYDGVVTVHQSAPEGGNPRAAAEETANFIRRLAAETK